MRKRNNKMLSTLIALAVTGTVMVGANTAYAACTVDGCTICNNSSVETGMVNIGNNNKLASTSGVVIGNESYADMNGIAIGSRAKDATGDEVGAWAYGTGAIAIGQAASVGSEDDSIMQGGVAIGIGSSVAAGATGLGAYTSVNDAYSVAIGFGSRAIEPNVVSVGSGDSGDAYAYRRIVNVADGTDDHDAVTLGQLNNALKNVSGGSGVTSAVTAVTYDDATGQLSVTKTEITDGATTDTTQTVDMSGFYASNQSVNDIVGLTQDAKTVNDAYTAEGTNYLNGAQTLVDADVALDSAIKANEGRIETLETDVTALGGRVDDLADTVSGLQGTTAAQNEKIGKLEGDVDTLKTDVSNLKDADTALQGSINDLKGTVQDNSGKITTLTNNVNSLTDRVDSITSISTDVIGAGDADTLTNTYQETTHLKEATTLVEADVALDKAITANTAKIETNTKNIAANTTAIEANSQAIAANSNAIAGLSQNIGSLSGRLDKVGAGAAALAALHPLDYDPEDKLSFSAGVGNYGGETAGAVGAFYRPNEDVMFSIGGTAGNGENMVNLGVSFALGKGGEFSKLSKADLIQEVKAVKEENKELKAENREIRHELNKLKELVLKLAEEK